MTPITEVEVAQLRSETKGAFARVHFNNAGASLPPAEVLDTVIDYLKEEAINGGYETEAKWRDQIQGVYSSIARLINAEINEVTITESASVAWGIAFNGIEFEEGDVILTSEFEYITNFLGLLNAQKKHHVKVKVIPNDDSGNFSLSALTSAVSPRVKLIAVTHISSTGGGILPINEIGEIARANDILYLIDACQSAGQIPLDVKAIQCDLLAVTGRKFLRAPRGTGFLYVRKNIQERLKVLFMDSSSVVSTSGSDFKLRDDARRFELYEKNRGLSLGLGRAIEYAMNVGIGRIWERVQRLAAVARAELQKIRGVMVHDIGNELCGIVTFSVGGLESAVVKTRLAENGIVVWVGLQQSTYIYMEKHHLKSVVRASVHYYNTEEEIYRMIEVLKHVN